MKGSRNTSGFILLDMLVSLPILVFLLAAMGAMAVMAFRAAFFMMADSELQQEVQMAVRQVAEDARTSYAIRGFAKDEKPGYTFYQYRSPDEASSSTFRTQYWVHKVGSVDKLVWKDEMRPLTGNHSLAGVDITAFSCSEVAPRLHEIRLTGRSRVTRHSYTSGGRHESVAEHSWRITLMAFLLRDEFPELDMDKVLRMCLIHDLGECFTGDIPAFDKTADDSAREEELLGAWVAQLPQPVRGEMAELYAEMEAFGTPEARVYKCLDKLEAVIQHNESPISTWEPLEYDLNRTYANENVAFSPYLTRLRREILRETEEKIARGE